MPVALTPAQAAVVILAATAAYGALHSWLASLPAKRAARRLFGPSSDRFYRVTFNVLGTVTLLPLLAFTAWQPGVTIYVIPYPFTWIFLAGQAAAVAVVVIGLLQTDAWHFLGVRQLLEPAGDPPRLSTSGLYRYVRHPLYAAGLAFLWLTPLMTTTLFAMYVGLSLYLYIGSLFEERRLVAEFGTPYRDYQRRVPRFFPSIVRPGPAGSTEP